MGHIEVVKVLLQEVKVIEKVVELNQYEFIPENLKNIFIF